MQLLQTSLQKSRQMGQNYKNKKRPSKQFISQKFRWNLIETN